MSFFEQVEKARENLRASSKGGPRNGRRFRKTGRRRRAVQKRTNSGRTESVLRQYDLFPDAELGSGADDDAPS